MKKKIEMQKKDIDKKKNGQRTIDKKKPRQMPIEHFKWVG